MLGQIFTKSQNKIQDPAKLYKLIDLIDKENWVMMGADVKGDIYEGLPKNAKDTKSGAGQYFTPRALIRAMVECVRPEPMHTIADPACGTGGFFLAAYDFIVEHHKDLDREQKKFLKLNTFYGNEIVAGTRRLAMMNLFMHNIGDIVGDNPSFVGTGFISPADALIAPTDVRYDYVLANPPFGKKSRYLYQRRRRTGKRRPHLQSPGLLGDHQQQATELRSAHPLDAKDNRQGSSSCSGQMFCLKAVQERPFVKSCWKQQMYIPSFVCQPVSFTPTA